MLNMVEIIYLCNPNVELRLFKKAKKDKLMWENNWSIIKI